MKPLTMTGAARALVVLACALTLGQAQAQGRDRDHDHDRFEGRLVLDGRHHNDHYYPAPGGFAPVLPRGAIGISFHDDRFFFQGGVWYQPFGGRFRVVVPPVGIMVSLLPPSYVTLNVGGINYYYANGVYYTAAVAGPGFVVVAPPPDVVNAVATPAPTVVAAPAPAPAPAKPDPIIYPRNGQSAQQQEADRQDCNRWASTQPSAMADASVFNRAVEACMDGRGYTMR